MSKKQTSVQSTQTIREHLFRRLLEKSQTSANVCPHLFRRVKKKSQTSAGHNQTSVPSADVCHQTSANPIRLPPDVGRFHTSVSGRLPLDVCKCGRLHLQAPDVCRSQTSAGLARLRVPDVCRSHTSAGPRRLRVPDVCSAERGKQNA